MIKTFTQEELIRYIYDEVSEATKEQVELVLRFDEELAEQCSDLLISKHAAEKVVYKPSERSVASILAYSRQLNART